MPATIYTRLKRLIVERLGIDEDEVSLSASFVDDFNADSLELAEFTSDIEEEFDIEITGSDARLLLTVQEAMDYIEDRLA